MNGVHPFYDVSGDHLWNAGMRGSLKIDNNHINVSALPSQLSIADEAALGPLGDPMSMSE